jgi:hypothetical protein
LAFLECYLDESGTHSNAEVCTVSGYVAGKGQFNKFDSLWNEALADFGVPYFHAKEFWARVNGKRIDPYAGWDDKKDDEFLGRLAIAITSHKLSPISCTIFNGDFFKCGERLRKYLTGAQVKNAKFVTSGCPSRPYYMAFLLCVTTAVSFVPTGGRSKVQYFCGLDRVMRGYAAEFLGQILEHPDTKNRECIGNIDFPLAAKTSALQAADLLAYLTYQHALNKLKDWNTEPANLLRVCLQRTRSLEDHHYLNKEGLELIIAETRPALRQWLLA